MKYRKPTSKELRFVDEEECLRRLDNDFSIAEAGNVKDMLECFDGELKEHGLELEVLNMGDCDDVIYHRIISITKHKSCVYFILEIYRRIIKHDGPTPRTRNIGIIGSATIRRTIEIPRVYILRSIFLEI